MKNFKKTLVVALMTTLALTSCTKRDDIDIPIRPSAQEFTDIKQLALDNKVQEFQFNVDGSVAHLTSAKGVQININSSCLTLNGNAVTGDIDIEFVELFEKGDMLTTNKPTMGIMPNGDKAMLISGGEFFVKVSQNGAEIETNCGFQLIIPASLTGGVDNDMTLWKGVIDGEGNLDWKDAEGRDNKEERVFAEGGAYYTFAGEFGWTNVDKFYNDPRPKTTILVDVPDGYDNQNSAVYLSYDGEAPALAKLDTYDNATGLFSEHYGQIPIGLECHVIFVSEENDNFKYAIKAATIVENGVITILDSEIAVATEAQIAQLMNDLP